MIKILFPGFQTTLQDPGRPGFAHLGISACGAADAVALQIGNLIVGNPNRCAGLEMTLTGASISATEDCTIALTGANIDASIDGYAAPMWKWFTLGEGKTLTCGNVTSGARTYLCVRGGILGTEFLGSAATHLPSKIGGLDGRALKAGAVLERGPFDDAIPPRLLSENAPNTLYSEPRLFHVTPAPQMEWFNADAISVLENSQYVVSEKSNRMGLRLEGPPLELKARRELLTEGISLGALQISAGQPIISFVDHQTTGGYPKLCNIISADLHKIGQLRPRDSVRFVMVSPDEAIERLKALHTLLSSAVSFQL